MTDNAKKIKFPLWKIEGTIDNQIVDLKFTTKVSRTVFNEFMDSFFKGVPEGGSHPIGKYQISLEEINGSSE